MDFEAIKTELLCIFNKAWVQQEDQIQKLSLTEEKINEYYRESAEMLIGWGKRNMKPIQDGAKRPETEVKLFSQIHGVMGIIDAIHYRNGKVTLTDYKTSKKEEISQDIKVQMAIYALLYQDNFGVLPDTIVIDFLKPQIAVNFRVTADFIHYATKICQEIHEKTSSLNEKDYPCKCGGWCEKDFIQNGGR